MRCFFPLQCSSHSGTLGFKGGEIKWNKRNAFFNVPQMNIVSVVPASMC